MWDSGAILASALHLVEVAAGTASALGGLVEDGSKVPIFSGASGTGWATRLASDRTCLRFGEGPRSSPEGRAGGRRVDFAFRPSPQEIRMTRVALLEFASAVGSVEANIDRALAMIEEASRKGAELAILPELWNTGYLAGRLVRGLAETLSGQSVSSLAEAARLHRLWIVAGSIAESRSGAPYNTSALLDARGRVRLVHRKVHLWTDYERRWFVPGSGFQTTRTPWGRAGVMVCYDGDFPEVPRLLALHGATILFHPSAYPARWRKDWEMLYPAWARANGVFLLGVNHVGREIGTYARQHWPEGVAFHGGSQVLGPNGRVLYRSRARGPAVHVIDVNFRMSRDFLQRRTRALRDRRPREYRRLVAQ